MAVPQPKRIAFFTSAFIFLLTTRGVNSASSPSCTGDDCPPFLPGAVAYWPLTLETKGSDMSGNGNHATFVNLSYTDGPSGEPNGAIHFPGNRKSYSWITMSPSLEVGKYPGFSFCGFVRLSVDGYAPFLDWGDVSGASLTIWGWQRPAHIALNLEASYNDDTAIFPNMTFTIGSWRFFGVSYNKATGRVIAFMDGMKEQKKIRTNLVAGTASTRKVGLGTRLSDKFYFEGDLSCMMLFKVTLTADDFENVWRFCRTRSSTQTTPFIPGAVAYWPLTLETKGSDMSGNGNHATFVNLTYTGGPNGEPNSAVHFHGNTYSYAWILKTPSMDVGQYPGFSFCGFVRLSVDQKAALIDWRDIAGTISGMQIWVYPTQHIYIDLHTRAYAHTSFLNMRFTTGSWQFFGASYDKATGRVTGFMDGMKEQKQLDKNMVAVTDRTRKVILGKYQDHFSYNGDMSCMMLFKVALTAEDFERVWKFCRTIKSTQTALLNITVSDIAATTATASWTKSPGTFSGYSITIERNGGGPGQETSAPQSIPSSVLFPRVTLANLIPGATYRVRIWHMQGDIKGGARSSAWFNTLLLFPVKPESIIFSAITASSAKVTWDEATGYADGYSVEIRPTTGGAKVDPSTVPRGTTTTSLKNLSPGSYYTIIIRSKIRSDLSSPSMKSLQTPAATDPPKPDTPKPDPPKPEPPIAVIGLAVAVICLVVMIALIAVIVILFRRISSLSTRSGDARNLPMSNLGFQPDEPSISRTKNEGEYDGYEVPDRSKYGGNSGSRQMPHQSAEDSNETTADNVYENFNN